MNPDDAEVGKLIKETNIRVLDDLLWYYGRVQNTDELSDEMWCSRIMSMHHFRLEEKRLSENKNG